MGRPLIHTRRFFPKDRLLKEWRAIRAEACPEKASPSAGTWSYSPGLGIVHQRVAWAWVKPGRSRIPALPLSHEFIRACLRSLLPRWPSCNQEDATGKWGLSRSIYSPGLSLRLQVFLCIESPWRILGFTAKAGWSESDLIWILLQALYLFYFRDNSRLESIIVLGGKLMWCRETLGKLAQGEREREKVKCRLKSAAQTSTATSKSPPHVSTVFCKGSGSRPLLCWLRDRARFGYSLNQPFCPPKLLPLSPAALPPACCLSFHPGTAATGPVAPVFFPGGRMPA